MVLLIIIPIKWLFHWEYTLFSDKPICFCGVYVVESSGRAQTPFVTELVGIGSSSSGLVGDLIPG